MSYRKNGNCINCGKTLNGYRSDQMYCGATCRKRAERERKSITKRYSSIMHDLSTLRRIAKKHPDELETIYSNSGRSMRPHHPRMNNNEHQRSHRRLYNSV